MGINVGSVEVSVVPVARTFDRDLAAQLNPAAKKAGEQAGQDLADGIQKKYRENPPKTEMPVPDRKKSDAEIDRFLRDFNAKMKREYDQTGQDSGSALANGLRLSFLRNSPIIAAAVGGGLIAGAPLAIAGAGVLFGGIAAVAVKNNAQVHAAAADMANQVMGVFKDTAQVTVPMFVSAIQSIGTTFQNLKPQFAAAFSALGGPIGSIAAGIESLVQNAMPGLVQAVQKAGPVFAGLQSLLGEIGTGLGQFFSLVSQHGAAAGQVFASLGQILGAALPILGRLIDVGVQLGAEVLPPVASALGLVANVLGAIAPVLPVVVAGLGGLMIARALQGPLSTLAQNLAFASYQGGALGKSAGLASNAVSGLSNGLPLLGLTVGLATQILQRSTDQAHLWAQALLDGGKAADTAQAQMSDFGQAMRQTNTGVGGFLANLVGLGVPLANTAMAIQGAKDQQKAMLAQMSPLQQAQQGVTAATNDYLDKVQRYGADSGQAAGAAAGLADAQSHLDDVQGQVNSVTETAATKTAKLKGELQLTADAASAANTEIGLLKGGLDALTGANVTLDQAQIAVTQSEDAITQAVKGHSAALVFNKGQLDLSNAGSAQASQLLIQLAGNMHQQIATMQESGASTVDLNNKTDDLRNQFIRQAEQLGATAAEAKTLADRYFGVPDQVHTQLTADATQANGVLDAVQTRINQLMTDHVVHLSAVLQTGNMIGGLGFNAAKATGGPIHGPGTGTSDTAGLFALSNGEHVWTASEVSAAGGHAAVEAIRANALAAGRGLRNGGGILAEDGSRVNANFYSKLGPGIVMAEDGSLVRASTYYGSGTKRINVTAADAGFGAAVGNLDQSIWQAARQIAAGASSGAGGAARWAPVVLQALAMLGLPAMWLGSTLRRMNQESGGNPTAINNWDINAQRGTPSMGLMQTIGPTFTAYHYPGTSWSAFDPLANILASMRYAEARYGSLPAAYDRPGGYKLGTNYVPSDGMAYLHRGEAVVPASANQGAPWQGGNVTVIAQFDDQMFEAKAVQIVGEFADVAHRQSVFNG